MSRSRSRFQTLAPAVAGLLLVLSSCRPAVATDPTDRCLRDMRRVNRTATTKYFRCALGDAAAVPTCMGNVGVRTRRSIGQAAARSGSGTAVCPTSAPAFTSSGPWPWPMRVASEETGGGVAGCAAAQREAARRFALAFVRCLERPDDPAALADCEDRAASAFHSAWGAAAGGCSAERGDDALTRIENEILESDARLSAGCTAVADAALYRHCDDGNAADNDGCSSSCRSESCGRVGDEVRCLICPADSVADETVTGCRCHDGSEGTPGACVVVDQCAVHGAECPEGRPCINVGSTWACAIPCDAQSFQDALASCGAPGGAIAFDCQDAVIQIPAGTPGARETTCHDLVIDGAGHNITFELAPLCWQTPLAPEQCPDGLEADGTCRCPNVDNGEEFLQLRGDRNTVRDLTVRGFFEGIPARGRDNVVENVRFDRMCDDAFGSVLTGVGNTFRHLVVTNGCDKCSENGGAIEDTDPDPRVPEHFNGIISDVTFEGCRTPVRVASSGRFRLEDLRMGSSTPDFPCDGPRFSGGTDTSRIVLDVSGNTITGCRHGMRLGRGVEAMVRDTRIAGCALRGLRLGGTARASLEGTTIESNGGETSAETGFGGVAVVGDAATVDLGGGSLSIDDQVRSSAGENSLCNNFAPDRSRRDLDVPLTYQTSATGNWWCTTTTPLDRIVGDAAADPFLLKAPLRYRP